MKFHEIELEWIHRIQSILRSSLMDHFFIGWNFVDTFFFLVILICGVWFFIGKRIGIRMLYVFILSSIVNGFSKKFFAFPRPCQLDPMVGVLNFSSFGFPSGAAQTAVIIAGVIFIECKKRFYQYSGLLFAFFLCFSRVYLGLHFFSDILGGIIIGLLLVLVYWQLSQWMKQEEKKALFLSFALVFLVGQSKFLAQYCLSIGLVVGFFLGEKKYTESKNWCIRAIEAMSAILGFTVFFRWKGLYPNLELIFAFMAGLWFSYFGPFLVRKTARFFKAKKG